MENIQVLPADHPARREIVLSDPTPPPAGNMLELMTRLAADPKTNIELTERIFAIQERIEERNYNRANEERIRLEQQDRERRQEAAQRGFELAMIACQKAMKVVARDANNAQTKSKYATYAQLDLALRPIYTSNNLSISFSQADCPMTDQEKINHELSLELLRILRNAQEAGEKFAAPKIDQYFETARSLRASSKIKVVAYVTHAVEGLDSYTREYPIIMTVDGKGAKGGDVMTANHATGSGFTYARRYALTNIFNIATADNDGNGAGDAQIPLINTEQAQELKNDIDATGTDIRLVLKAYKVSCVEEMTTKQFDHITAILIERKQQQKAAARAKAEKGDEWSTAT